MKAAVFHGVGRIETRADLARPVPGPGEVLIRVASCGICGSDMHIYRVDSPSAREMYAGTLRVDAAFKAATSAGLPPAPGSVTTVAPFRAWRGLPPIVAGNRRRPPLNVMAEREGFEPSIRG